MDVVFLRLPQVLTATGLSRAALYKAIKSGVFPKQVALSDSGRAVAWLSSDIKVWQDGRIAASRRVMGDAR